MSDRLCGSEESHGPHAWTGDTIEWCPGRCDNEPCMVCDGLEGKR